MAKLCLVNKTWNSLVTPMLYNTVILNVDSIVKSPLRLRKFWYLTWEKHRGVPYIRNFGVRGDTCLRCVAISAVYRVSIPRYGGTLKRDWRTVLREYWRHQILAIVKNFRKNQLRSFIWHTDLDIPNCIAARLATDQQKLTDLWFRENQGISNGYDKLKTSPFLRNCRQLHFFHDSYIIDVTNFIKATVHVLPYLTAFTFAPLQGNLLDRGSPQQDRVAVKADSEYRAPRLKYLCLKAATDSWFNGAMPLGSILDIRNLSVLKLYNCSSFENTLKSLTNSPLRLNIFHFTGSAENETLATVIASFNGLVELYLDVASMSIKYVDLAKAIKSHGSTLETLFFRIGTAPLSATSIRSDALSILARECRHIRQLAITIASDFDNLVWILNDGVPANTPYPTLSAWLQPFHNDKVVSGSPQPRFVAIGKRDKNTKSATLIFEIHEHETIAGNVRTSFNYLTHRQMWEACPDLTLLNLRTEWLPWEE
ncbi:hypothetical protein ABW21_db0205243 [Orbilia brochopaga]|nr:hypothetical protein ABW21_db0205243 [Drechslerella brochopaga]